MGLYEEHILPRLVHRALDQPRVHALRKRTAKGLSGRVLEIGFGSGPNLVHLPPTVEGLFVVEPSEKAFAMARENAAFSRFPVERVGLDGQSIGLDDASMDAVLMTFTLCTIPDAQRALAEIRRILRPGGALHFLEHGAHPQPGIQRWQARLNPVWKVFSGGCHLDRPIPRLIEEAGFAFPMLEESNISGPSIAHHVFWGIARAK